MELFKRIAFQSGMPLVIVDLFMYITGSDELIKKLMKVLIERVPSKHKEKMRKNKNGEKQFGAMTQAIGNQL